MIILQCIPVTSTHKNIVTRSDFRFPSGFQPGWNGEARTPPLGWRSWNAFGPGISQDIIKCNIDMLTNKTAFGYSLADRGYIRAGIDEGWEGCGMGVNGSQHDADGLPIVNTKFPDMHGLVEYGHAHGLLMGWYQNGCACGERIPKLLNYKGDIKSLYEYGFDAVKFDGCGAQNNMTLYAILMEATGRSYEIENCHGGDCTHDDTSSCPTHTWCPFNHFRTSRDIDSCDTRWMLNLQSVISFLNLTSPLSQQYCWAYPDMLEVGRLSTYQLNRAHFGAWCIISAPLILGFDLRDPQKLDVVWDIITNQEAILVNQQWAGHPGILIKTWTPSLDVSEKETKKISKNNIRKKAETKFAYFVQGGDTCDTRDITQTHWSYNKAARAIIFRIAPNILTKGRGNNQLLCLDYSNVTSALQLEPCDGSAGQQFDYNNRTHKITTNLRTNRKIYGFDSLRCLDAQDWDGPNLFLAFCFKRNSQKWNFGDDGTLGNQQDDYDRTRRKCVAVRSTSPCPGSPANMQLWVKMLPDGAMAVLLLNLQREHTYTVGVDFALDLNITCPMLVRDIWLRMDMGVATSIKVTISGYDSKFYRLSPSTQ